MEYKLNNLNIMFVAKYPKKTGTSIVKKKN